MLAGLAYQLDWNKFGRALSTANFLLLVPAVLTQLASTFLSVTRWKAIINNFDIRVRFVRLLRFSFIGSFFNLVLPSSIGGDFFRAFYLSKEARRGMSTTLTTTLLERSGGLCALLAIGVAAAVTHRIVIHGIPLLYLFLALITAYALVNFALFNPRIHRLLNRLLERLRLQNVEENMELVYRGLNALIRNRKAIGTVLALSLIIQFGSVVIVWIAAQALAIDAPFSSFLVFIPLINLSIMIPLTINGFGLRESLYFLLFTHIGLQQERAVALSLLNTLVVVMVALPGGILYSLHKKEESYPPLEASR